jgi:hypothetical protein
MRAASPLLAMPGGKPRKPRVSAEHPDESGCGAHECALDELPSHPHAESLSRLGKDPSPASPRIFICFRGHRVENTLAGNRSLTVTARKRIGAASVSERSARLGEDPAPGTPGFSSAFAGRRPRTNRLDELRSSADAGDLGSDAGVRPGVRALPGVGAIRADPERTEHEQGYRLLDEIRSFGEPLMVFTGGDPLKRPDLFDLIRYASRSGCAPT